MAPSQAPSRTGRVSIRELRARRYLSYGSEDDPTFDRVHEFAHRHGLEGPLTPHVPHIETLRSLVRAGAGYTILPAYTILRDLELGQLVSLQPNGLDARMEVSIMGRSEQVVTPAQDAVRAVLQGLRTRLEA